MSLGILILITCAAMVVKDATGTILGVAEARGNRKLSAQFDPACTLAGIAFYSYGATSLTHGRSWEGWLGILPVLVIDVIDGLYWTAVADHIKSPDNDDGVNVRGLARACRVELGTLRQDFAAAGRAIARGVRRLFRRRTPAVR